MTELMWDNIGTALGLNFQSLVEIKENAYCHIFQAMADGSPIIIKKYKGDDSRLARMEAEALDFYHRLSEGDQSLISSRAIKFIEQENLIAIGFVEGEAMSDFLYSARHDRERQQRAVRFMSILGNFLRRLHELTRAEGAETDPFIFEYMAYCSRRLESLPTLGPLLFRGLSNDAALLIDELRASRVAPSFIHGDFVFRNIHVSGERVGLIDFANTNLRSHLLNDLYNLRLALANMVLPRAFKSRLLAAFYEGLGRMEFPAAAHHFYYEYHRRRWLMLKIRSHSPLSWVEASRGIARFARPFSPEVIHK